MSEFAHLKVGTPVSIVWYVGDQPFTAIGTVANIEPFWIEVHGELERNRPEGRIKLLIQDGGILRSADAVVGLAKKHGDKLRIVAGEAKWSNTDRRAFTRYPAALKAKCRFVSEGQDSAELKEFTVTTKDISYGGAWVKSDYPIQLGSILTVELGLQPQESVRALGVVAWTDPNGEGFGVEFLDLIGASKNLLAGFLGRRAA
jgi:hypothetical protein